MRVSDLMTTYLEFASPSDSLQSLAELMGDLDVGSVPIGTAEEPLGVVTDRDVLYRAVAKGLDPKAVTAREIASAPLVTCAPTDGLKTALDLMASRQIRRLGVADNGRLVGWLTLADVSRALLLDTESVPKALGELSADTVG